MPTLPPFRASFLLLALLALPAGLRADDPEPRPAMGEIIRLDPALDALLPKDSKLEMLASGLDWSEGPVWSEEQEAVLFSDVPQNVVFKWKEGEGLSQYLKPSGYTGPLKYSKESGSNGLVFDAKGGLISCEHGDRRVSLLRKGGGGGKITLADNYEGKRFNSPNDACVDRAGNVYFTDPPYGLPNGSGDSQTREIPWNGVYRIAPDKTVKLLSKDMTFPNGIALSPDEKTLYVAQSDGKAALWKAFPITPAGDPGESRVVADVTEMMKTMKGAPDGMKVDDKGNLWATGPGGIHIMTPEGKLLGRIDTKMPTGNCCFGGSDRNWLYICADAFLCRIKISAN